MRTWLSIALLSFPTAAAVAGTPLPDAPHVVVHGEGEISVAPDSVRVTMVASHRSAEAGDAKRRVDRAVDALLEIAPRFGVTPDRISASDLELGEDRDYDDEDRPRPPTQYLATREVEVRLDDPGRLGAWVEEALDAGFTSITDVGFESSREPSLRADARARAVADAREKASGLAEAFGGRLGPVYSINSLGMMQTDGYGATLDSIVVTGSRVDAGRYLEPKIDVTERVTAVFEIVR